MEAMQTSVGSPEPNFGESMLLGVNRLVVQTSCIGELYSLFAGTFGLAFAETTGEPGFQALRIYAGNVTIDCGSAHSPRLRQDRVCSRSIITGVSFEPRIPVPVLCAELRRRGLRVCSHLHPRSGGGNPVQTLALLDVVHPYGEEVSHAVQLTDFDALLNGGAAARTVSPVWCGVEEVLVEGFGFEDTRRRWCKLLDPLPMAGPGTWHFACGPTLRLLAGDRNRLRGLVVATSSLDDVERLLRARTMAFSRSSDRLTIDPSAAGDLEISFTVAANQTNRRWLQ